MPLHQPNTAISARDPTLLTSKRLRSNFPPAHAQVSAQMHISPSNPSRHVSPLPSSHVRAHTVDNGAGVQQRPLNVADFRLGNVLGAGGAATVIQAEFAPKPGRSDLRCCRVTSRAQVPARTLNTQSFSHSRQPSSPQFRPSSSARHINCPQDVHRHLCPSSTRQVALKVVQKKALNRRARHYLTREIAIHRALHDHANVVPLLDVFEDSSAIYMVQEMMHGGDLFTALKRERRGVSESVALDITAQILQAVAFMHERGFAHRDIKPENLMFAERPALGEGRVGTVKLIDFGLACARDPHSSVNQRMSSEKCGTVRYAAPEVLSENWYVPELADVWSIGVVLYSAIAYNNPFMGKSEKEVLARIESGGPSFDGPEWGRVGEGTKRLVKWLLQMKPSDRPSAKRALEEINRIVGERSVSGNVNGRVEMLHQQRDCAKASAGEGANGCTVVKAGTSDNRGENRGEELWHLPNLFEGIRALFTVGMLL